MKKFVSALLLACAAILAGCPRFAEVEMFNHLTMPVRVVHGGAEGPLIAPGASYRFRLSTESFSVVTADTRWDYARRIPHAGENGVFFDGRLRVQIETDGSIFALKKEESFPLVAPSVQPKGFPLRPKNSSRASHTTKEMCSAVSDDGK